MRLLLRDPRTLSLFVSILTFQAFLVQGGEVKEGVVGKEDGKSEESKAVPDSAFAKRQGMVLIDGEEDQLAMESQQDQVAVESVDQVAVESNHKLAVPIPMRQVPANIMFPMPPQGAYIQHGPPPPGSVLAMRAPPPFAQQQKQQQYPQQQQAPPPHNYIRGAPLPTPQPHQQVVSTPAGDMLIQKATEISISGRGHHNNHQQSGFAAPGPHPQQRFQQQQQHHQQQQRPQVLTSSEITKNIIRELFEKKPPGMKDGRPNGGFFGPPTPQAKRQRQPTLVAAVPGGSSSYGKEALLSSNDLSAEGAAAPPAIHYGGPQQQSQPITGGSFSTEGAAAWPSGPDSDTPKIVSLEVKCERNVMRVFVAFDKPFYGVIFSKGHYHNVNCIHLPAGLGHTSANFDVSIDSCGTQGNSEIPQAGGGSYFENTIVIQYDSQVQEVWDQARKLRCTWHDQYEKSVTFRPFPVDQLDVVRADFAGDNVGCWMQIQVGKGPWASEVSGLVKIGQTMTMVLAIKDDDNKFDMMVRNCVAHDGERAPIQLVDQWGCITRPKLMSPFTKIKNFGASATVLSYAHFQAFKFPDSMEVHFQCTIQICRHQCPEQCSQPGGAGPGGYVGKSGLPAGAEEEGEEENVRRRRRAVNETETEEVFEYQTTFKTRIPSEDVGLNRVITVVSPDDLDFVNGGNGGDGSEEEEVPLVESSSSGGNGDIVCMSTMGFAAMITLLIGLLLLACIISAVILLRRPRRSKGKGFQ